MKTVISINQQSGTALIVSLVILLVLTIIGVSSISNTNLEERMAQNFQTSAITFQAAESAINSIINASNRFSTAGDKNPFYTETNDPTLATINTGTNVITDVTNLGLTKNPTLVTNNHLNNVNTNITATMEYTGYGACPGMSSDSFICYFVEINTNASIDNVGSNKTHIQGYYDPAPKPN